MIFEAREAKIRQRNPGYLVHRISKEEHCIEEDALKRLLKTMTYELLQDRESGLYAESPECIWSMLQEEKIGNEESWIKE